MEKAEKKNQSKSSSAFLLTLNQPERFDDLRNYLENLRPFQYGIAGKEEAPSTGHKHIHIFVQFSKSVRLSLKKVEGAHIDKCFGTPQQNKKYVEKGDVIWEKGEMKTKGFLTIKEVKNLEEREREALPIRFYNIVEKINTEEATRLVPKNMYKKVKVYYISGPSGIGKTTFAKHLIGDQPFNIVKYANGFWMGVGKERIALYDDWRDSHMKPSEFLNFIDYNKQIMNVKGGFCVNNYEIIIITTIFRLATIYLEADGESRIQWERRLKEIRLSKVYNKERENQLNLLFYLIKLYIKQKIYYLFKKLRFKK